MQQTLQKKSDTDGSVKESLNGVSTEPIEGDREKTRGSGDWERVRR